MYDKKKEKFPNPEDCHATPGFKDYKTGLGHIDCGEYGRFVAEARRYRDGALDPPCHTKGRMFGGTGSAPDLQCDLSKQKGVRPATTEETRKARAFEQGDGKGMLAERDRACINAKKQMERMEKQVKGDLTKANKNPNYPQFRDFFNNVCTPQNQEEK